MGFFSSTACVKLAAVERFRESVIGFRDTQSDAADRIE